MPSLIIFGARPGTGTAAKNEQLRVDQDAEDVAGALSKANGGFARFERKAKGGNVEIWVNASHVKMVRGAK